MLACSPEGNNCREMRSSHIYDSIESCRANLSSTLREMSQKGQPVIGRCASEEGAGLDAITTGAVDSDFAVVRVTRMQGGGSSTTAYRVPKSIQ
jgi:hypothetical protein